MQTLIFYFIFLEIERGGREERVSERERRRDKGERGGGGERERG